MDKFATNVARDEARKSQLKRAGLRTITVWECETENAVLLDKKLVPLLGIVRGPRAAAPARTEGAGR